MPKNISTLLILLVLNLPGIFSQPTRVTNPRVFFIDPVILPSAKGAECFIAYRVEYTRLVFVKNDKNFTAKYSFSVEARDSATDKVVREIVSNEINADSYEQTNEKNLYSQGILKLELKPGKYKILPVVNDLNTGLEHSLPQFDFRVDAPEESQILLPIVTYTAQVNGESKEVLANYEGNIPFSREAYNLIIPVRDTSDTPMTIELVNNDSTVMKSKADESFVSGLGLNQSGQNIILENKLDEIKTRNYIFRNINRLLKEGQVVVKVARNGDSPKEKNFYGSVKWYNKPAVLFNVDYAIKILKYIAGEDEVASLAKNNDAQLYQALFNYWHKLDPTPGTTFNELMEEYYQRVDYAIDNFSITPTRNGAETDRGKVYIRFGKPHTIERSYNDSKEVTEIWLYDNPQKHFVFVDKTGLGNFVLSQNL